MKMKNRKLLANVSAKLIARVATVSASAACGMYFYQPKTPANISKRLEKS